MRHRPSDHEAVLGGDLGARIERWAADARVDEAAASRSRERWLRTAAEHDATLAGVLVDLAESGEPVVVRTCTGRRHLGTVRAVAADCVVLHTRVAGDVVLSIDAVVEVRPERGTQVTGDRAAALDLTMVDVLDRLAADRPRVAVLGRDGETLAGELRAVGRDVVTLRLDGEPRSTVYVPVRAIVEAWLA